MEFSLHLSGDPNTHKNRVPDKTELTTLRNLAQYNTQLMQDLDRQLEKGRADCATIQQRYEEQIRTIEGTRSELMAANRFVRMVEAQKNHIRTDLNRLNGLIHPIRRCPSDILQLIFEWAVKVSPERWFHMAIDLSQVCRRWRSVAIRTPYLWTSFDVSLTSPPAIVCNHWRMGAERAKAAPARVVIADINSSDARWEVMDHCHLDKLQNVAYLLLQLDSRDPDAGASLHSNRISVPQKRVDHLEVATSDPHSGHTVNISSLANTYPSVTSVTMVYITNVTLATNLVVPTVTRLTIKITSSISLGRLAKAFPNLEEAHFDNVYFQTHTTGIVNWLKLRSLMVKESESFVWDNIWPNLNTPNIVDLITDQAMDNNIVNFIASHPTLLHLDLVSTHDLVSAHEPFESIDKKAPQLLSLFTDPCNILYDVSKVKLKKLTNLGLYQTEEGDLSVELFDKIVRSRFLPKKAGKKSGNKKSTGSAQSQLQSPAGANPPPTPTLTIMVEEKLANEAALDWRLSDFLSSAEETCSTFERWDLTWRSYCLKWQ